MPRGRSRRVRRSVMMNAPAREPVRPMRVRVFLQGQILADWAGVEKVEYREGRIDVFSATNWLGAFNPELPWIMEGVDRP